jgi:NAD(P)-dependent dehydrogenase (short-subunit alcohol dehydrogenase family)
VKEITMVRKLDGKTALVTAGSAGIGLGIVVHDAAAVRREGAAAPPRRRQNSEQFGVEVPMEVLLRHLLDRCEPVDARVVDEDINRPEGAFRLDEQASDIAPLGEEPWR